LLTNTLALAILVSTAVLLNARWEFRRRGKLTLFGVFLLCAMLLVPNLVLEYATSYKLPETALDYVGGVIAVGGFAICMASIVQFRSISKVFCVEPGDRLALDPAVLLIAGLPAFLLAILAALTALLI
jgi:putative flippase GtrA